MTALGTMLPAANLFQHTKRQKEKDEGHSEIKIWLLDDTFMNII